VKEIAYSAGEAAAEATVEGKATEPDKRLAFFGVYDGHGGDKVAIYTGCSYKVSDPVDRLLRKPVDDSGLHEP
jgi:serine/threonine protein phosphatase PrpC